MQFLRTLFWVIIGALVVLFAYVNWKPVELNLWANLVMEISLPLLLLFAFLIGFLPPWLILRGKLWRLRRRLAQEEQPVPVPPAPAAPAAEEFPDV